ncbi:M1 family aminopeptidase [Microbacteriaceae bacterium 4G12]
MNKYKADVKLDIPQRHISCHVLFTYHAVEKSEQVLTLYLHHQLEIQQIECKGFLYYEVSEQVVEWSPFVLESKEIRIYLDQPLCLGESLDIMFSYSGQISLVTQFGINRISEEWTELGLYTPWFPLAPNMEEAQFLASIDIDQKYIVVGDHAKKQGNTWVIQQDIPHADCTFLALTDQQTISDTYQGINIHIHFINPEHAPIAEKVNRSLSDIFKSYAPFGPLPITEFSFVILPREEGGGYCRPNFIVLCADERLDDPVQFHQFLAHEIAHLWWSQASQKQTWEDWLNESFAEYAALKAVQYTFGEQTFRKIIDSYAEQASTLPPIWGLDRSSRLARDVLYKKGPWLLYMLEKEIGEAMFFKFLRHLQERNVQTTKALLEQLSLDTSIEIAERFKQYLYS